MQDSARQHESAPHYVVVGCVIGMLGELDKFLPAGSVTVVEEADLLGEGELREKALRRSCVAQVLEGPAQWHGEGEPPALPSVPGTVAVLPTSEYTVLTAAAMAEAAGVPGAGLTAARTLRDKLRLREAAAAAGLPQPVWTQVADAADVRAFAKTLGAPYVLKPADHAATVGVLLLDTEDDADAAWAETCAADDLGVRSAHWTPGRFMAEQRLTGPEVSAEVLVTEGEVIWVNVTAKTVAPGTHPVELGHALPAALGPAVRERITEANQRLARAVGFGSGVLHSEWILVGGAEPYLVECAGRLPGDAIVPLIDLAYGGSLVEDLTRVLRGERPRRPADAAKGSAIRFVTAPQGTVREVRGVDAANAADGVFIAVVTSPAGSRVGPLNDNWDRSGHVLAVGADGPDAARLAKAAADLLEFDVEPDAADADDAAGAADPAA